MFNPSPEPTVVIPFKPGPEIDLGPVVNDAYFGKVPADRLVIKDSVLFFSGDGQHRSKIGISPARALPFLGSYDAENEVLTLAHLTIPERSADYVNSMWEIQKNPFGGDVVNSYNDGPPEPGAQPLGPFYELESSSPAAALARSTFRLKAFVEALFLAPATTAQGSGRLNPKVINTVWNQVCRLADDEGRTPHSARHGVGKHLIEKTGNIVAISRQGIFTQAMFHP